MVKQVYRNLEQILQQNGFNLSKCYENDSCISFGRKNCHYEVRMDVKGKPSVEIRIDFEDNSAAQNQQAFQHLQQNFPTAQRDTSMTSAKNIGAIIYTSSSPMSASQVAQKLLQLYAQTHLIVGL